MKIARALGACTALLVLAGCGTNDDAGTPGAESSLVGEGVSPSSGEASGDGSEGSNDADGPDISDGSGATTPDAPVEGGEKGSASLPSLPIGGSVSFEDASTPVCAFLAWNGGDIPSGAAVRIGSLSLPAGVAEDSGGGCDAPPCLGADSFTSDQQSCVVGLRWDGTAAGDEPSISASGSVTCEEQSACDQVREAAASGGGVASVEVPEVTGESGPGESEQKESGSAEPQPQPDDSESGTTGIEPPTPAAEASTEATDESS